MKKRLVVKYRNGDTLDYVNIAANHMEERDGFVFAYLDEKLVGAFDLGLIDAAYISGE